MELIWPGAGGFITDARIQVELDGDVVAEGSFLDGFRVGLQCPPGRHELSTQSTAVSFITRKRVYQVDLAAGWAYIVVLRYSRIWGNFTKDLSITIR